MGDLLDYTPIAAAAFAIPQFLPQLLKLRATDDTAGVSWSWATLTSVNNAAWFAYFALASYWTALVPAASSATLLAGALAIMLARRGQAKARPAVLISSWVALLVVGFTVAGRTGLGTLLTVAFILQVTPSLWTAYRTARLTGVAAGTWLLILGELSCWTIFGLHQGDQRLVTLGFTGVTASALMLARIRRTRRHRPHTRSRRPRERPAGRGRVVRGRLSGARDRTWTGSAVGGAPRWTALPRRNDLARTYLGERAEPKRRPYSVNGDLGHGTDAEVLERFPEHVAVQVGRDLGAALGVGDPEQAAGFQGGVGRLEMTIQGGPILGEHLDEIEGAVQIGGHLHALRRADPSHIAIRRVDHRGPLARLDPELLDECGLGHDHFSLWRPCRDDLTTSSTGPRPDGCGRGCGW